MTKFTTPKDLAFLRYFNELPSPIKEMAIENYHLEDDYTPKDLKDALWNFCVWSETQQGTSYWGGIIDMLNEGKPITNPVHLLPEGYKFEEVKVMSAEEIAYEIATELCFGGHLDSRINTTEAQNIIRKHFEAFASQSKTTQP